MSRHVHTSSLGLPLLFSLISVAVILLSLHIGYYPTDTGNFWRVLTGQRPADPYAPFVLLTLRLPRVLAAWLVGICLGLAGCVAQALTRNAIAEPGVLGINAGASLATLLTFVFWQPAQVAWLPLAALCGALLAAALVFTLSRWSGRSPTRLLITGVAVTTALSACILIVINFAESFAVEQALRWLLGSVAGVTWAQTFPLAVATAILAPILLLSGRTLCAHALPEDTARSLGARVDAERIGFLLVMASLAAAAVAAAGPIAFAGMLAPNGARRMAAQPGTRQLVLAALLGGILVLGADTLGRTLFALRELPCGLVTAILGAPCLLLLVVRERHRGRV